MVSHYFLRNLTKSELSISIHIPLECTSENILRESTLASQGKEVSDRGSHILGFSCFYKLLELTVTYLTKSLGVREPLEQSSLDFLIGSIRTCM